MTKNSSSIALGLAALIMVIGAPHAGDAGYPDVPADENAAPLYLKLFMDFGRDEVLTRHTRLYTVIANGERPFHTRNPATEDIRRQMKPLLAALAKADARPRVAWPAGEEVFIAHFNGFGHAAIWCAVDAAHAGRFEEAWNVFAAVARMGWRFASPDGSPPVTARVALGTALAVAAQRALAERIDSAERARFVLARRADWPAAPARMAFGRLIVETLRPRATREILALSTADPTDLQAKFEAEIRARHPHLKDPAEPWPANLQAELEALTPDRHIQAWEAVARILDQLKNAWDREEPAFFAAVVTDGGPAVLRQSERLRRRHLGGDAPEAVRQWYRAALPQNQGGPMGPTYALSEMQYRLGYRMIWAGATAMAASEPPPRARDDESAASPAWTDFLDAPDKRARIEGSLRNAPDADLTRPFEFVFDRQRPEWVLISPVLPGLGDWRYRLRLGPAGRHRNPPQAEPDPEKPRPPTPKPDLF